MRRHLRALLDDADLARTVAERGRATVLARHTCAHRVDELLAVARELGLPHERRAASDERRADATHAPALGAHRSALGQPSAEPAALTATEPV